MTPKTRLAIFGNKSQKEHLDSLSLFFELLCRQQAFTSISIDRRYIKFLHSAIGFNAACHGIITIDEDREVDADLVLSVGGDGTFLKTARRIGARQTPIMGINSGHLGYLAAASITDARQVVENIVSHNFVIEQRSVIEVQSDCPTLPERPFALNEVAILRRDSASMITVDASLDGSPLASYRGDGLIVATPTGSTGYNLSVGGPVVAPNAADWVISPIAPHSLNMRPLVVHDDMNIDISVQLRSDTFLLTIDGKATPMPADARLRLVKAPHCVNLVHSRDNNFIDTLRRKLLWGMEGN